MFTPLHILEGQSRCPIHQSLRMANMVNISVTLRRTKVNVSNLHPICIQNTRAELKKATIAKHMGVLIKLDYFVLSIIKNVFAVFYVILCSHILYLSVDYWGVFIVLIIVKIHNCSILCTYCCL